MSNQARTPATCPSCGDTLVIGVILAPVALAEAGEPRALQDRRPAPRGRAQGDGDAAVCPVHGEAAPSRFGGLYCPAKADAGFCNWTHGKPRGRRAG